MKGKTVYILVVLTCLFAMSVKSTGASESPTRTCQFMWGTQGRRLFINMTCPTYAAPGSAVRFDLVFFFSTYIEIPVHGERFEVSALLNNGSWQQIYYAIVLPDGTYANGTTESRTAYVTVPSNTKLGSLLNASVYTDLNAWMPYPTEIRDINYDDLQSAYNDAQSQINTLNEQNDFLNEHIANLNTEKNALKQQIDDLDSQVEDLKTQITLETHVIPLASVAVAAVAVCVAIYLCYSKRKQAYV